jgi:hypothetical protein
LFPFGLPEYKIGRFNYNKKARPIISGLSDTATYLSSSPTCNFNITRSVSVGGLAGTGHKSMAYLLSSIIMDKGGVYD